MSPSEHDNQASLDRAREAAQQVRSVQAEQAPARTTSLAKETDPEVGTTFDQAPNVRPAFEQAKAADVPLDTRPPEPDQRTVSAAQTIAPTQGTTFDKAPNLTENFAAAQAPPATTEQGQGRDDQSQGAGSQMVKDSKPHPYPAPKTPERAAVDADKFNQQWAAEQANANKGIEEARAAAAEVRAMQAEAGRGQEPSPGMGMG